MPSTKKLLQAAAGNAGGGDPLYVEDVYSTYLYDGNGSTQTITNGIDLAGEGGLVWIKSRDTDYDNAAYDTEGGVTKNLYPNLTNGRGTESGVTAFNSNGFTLGSWGPNNNSANDFVSWTFRKAKKFFDVVTYTGDGVTGRTVSHNLGSVPGFILVKCTSSAQAWAVYHGSEGAGSYTDLTTAPFYANPNRWNGTEPTESEFTCGNSTTVNQSGETFVAYLFASDAGGFGDDEDENIIKCGSYTGNGNADGTSVDCGFEPQFLMVKNATGGNWVIADTMRSFGLEDMASLYPNAANAESTIIAGKGITPTATGFKCIDGNATTNQNNAAHIYIAIRRPMKTPESGTEVFALEDPGYPLGSNGLAYTSGFPVDLALLKERTNSSDGWYTMSRMQGSGRYMKTNLTNAEASGVSMGTFDHNTGWFKATNASMSWMFKRAPGFMDVVAYSGVGNFRVLPHNLGVPPELIIGKRRNNSSAGWSIASDFAGGSGWSYLTFNNGSEQVYSYGSILSSTPTATSLYFWGGDFNDSSADHIAYLFATLAGVSKVGRYTGTGSNVDVDCGFSAGARFILIKRTDSNGDWYVYDSVRGIVAGNDPYMLLNSAAAEVTNTDYIDPLSSGFTVTSSAPAALNASGGSYLFLAIA